MRLSDILSNKPEAGYRQIEGFLDERNLNKGAQRRISIGNIALPFFCGSCQSIRDFYSGDQAYCIGIDRHIVSIDCVLTCGRCNQSLVPTWYLVSSRNEIFIRNPDVRLLKRSFKLSGGITFIDDQYQEFSEMLAKSQQAYIEELGAGSIVYLRKILERITVQEANVANIPLESPSGARKRFRDILNEVERARSIIPEEFSANGYDLFMRLSNVVHGDADERAALENYPAFRRLILGIIDKVRNRPELTDAAAVLGLGNDGARR